MTKQYTDNSLKIDEFQYQDKCQSSNLNQYHPPPSISNTNIHSSHKSLLKNQTFNIKKTKSFSESKKVLSFNLELPTSEKQQVNKNPIYKFSKIEEDQDQPSKYKSTEAMKIITPNKSDNVFNPIERRNKKYKSIVLIKKLNNTNLYENSELNDDKMSVLSKVSSNNPYCIIQSKIILDCDIKRAPTLKIEEMKGKILNNQTLIINAAGLINGLRNQRDGVSFFGFRQGEKNEIINDYIININDIEFTELRRFFAINFDLKTQRYYLRAINETKVNNKQMIYIKIDHSVSIEEKKFFLIGNSLISIEPMLNQYINPSINVYYRINIQIKIFAKNSDSLIQYMLDCYSEIKIGKDKKKCSVVISDSLVNDIQCIVKFEDEKWILETVNSEDNSKSWVWMILDEKYALKEITYCKISKYILRFSMYM